MCLLLVTLLCCIVQVLAQRAANGDAASIGCTSLRSCCLWVKLQRLLASAGEAAEISSCSSICFTNSSRSGCCLLQASLLRALRSMLLPGGLLLASSNAVSSRL
jgi:hypothetical protein